MRTTTLRATLAVVALCWHPTGLSAQERRVDYSPPPGAPYTAVDVRVPTPMGHTLAGTLTLPAGASRTKPVPAIVTISGTGPQDRDEYMGMEDYRPFRRFADSLARRGIAVLRMDDRGVGSSEGDFASATHFDFVEDIRAGLAFLRTRPEIDATRLGLLGHSEGALDAPIVATKEPALRALVLMAGQAKPVGESLKRQLTDLIEHDPRLDDSSRAAALANLPATIDSMLAASRYMAELLAYDPRVTARQVRTPAVLILTGETDRQADAKQVPEWVAEFEAAGNRDVTGRILPGLNHLFVPDPDGSPSGYAKLPSPVRIDSKVVGIVVDWLVDRLGSGASGERLELGRLGSRAILRCVAGAPRGAPIAILVPGTGGHGPEEAMPGSVTADGKDTQLLTSFADGLRAAGFHTLQLGKPGIEFHHGWDEATYAYDLELYRRLTWQDLLESTDEAIDYLSTERSCQAGPVVLAAHSEGSGRILDVTARNPKVRGLVFLGYHGHSLGEMVDFQAYRRPVDYFAKTDVDADRDGFITRDEAARWPREFNYVWKERESRVSIADYARSLRENAEYEAAIESLSKTPLYGDGIWDRRPMYDQVAALAIPVVAFNGSLDVVTPPAEIEALAAACRAAGKTDCETHLFPGIGHGFSPPRPPRGHPLLDQTEGPVTPEFLEFFSRTLRGWRSSVRAR